LTYRLAIRPLLTTAAAPAAVPAVNAAAEPESPCPYAAAHKAAAAAAVNAVANGDAAAIVPAVAGAGDAEMPCPHAAAGDKPCPMAGANGKHPCSGKDGKPCAREAAKTIAQAEKPAEQAKAESH
jgi:hypothetical protein